MKVFISWSGEKSRSAALALKDWLPQVINALQPWLSEEDIGKGRRWSAEIASQLEASKAGIVCVTASNRESPWLLFESGALSKAVKEAQVCPFLVDLAPADLTGPLAQFQATQPTKKDVHGLLSTLNETLVEGRRTEGQLTRAVEKWWPELNSALQQLPNEWHPEVPTRSVSEMIAEVLEEVRFISREVAMLQVDQRPRHFLSERQARRIREKAMALNAEIELQFTRISGVGKRIAPECVVSILSVEADYTVASLKKGRSVVTFQVHNAATETEIESAILLAEKTLTNETDTENGETEENRGKDAR